MATVASAFGLKPAYHPTGIDRPQVLRFAGSQSPFSSASVFKFTPILVDGNGQVAVSAAAGPCEGSFLGFEYTDGAGRRVVSPSNSLNSVGTTAVRDAQVHLSTDPNTVYTIQTTAAPTVAVVNDRFAFANVGNGSAVTFQSQAALAATATAAATAAPTRVIDLSVEYNDTPGDTFQSVRVVMANHPWMAANNN